MGVRDDPAASISVIGVRTCHRREEDRRRRGFVVKRARSHLVLRTLLVTHVEMSSSERNRAHGCCGQAEPSENPGSAGWRGGPGYATEFPQDSISLSLK